MPDVIREDVPYQAYSGCDMQVYMGHKLCGTLQALTISVTRETLPLYVMGDPNIKSIVRGKRGIAGTLVFTNFDRHALLMDHFTRTVGGVTQSLYGQTLGQSIRGFGAAADGLYSQFAGKNALLGLNSTVQSPTITNIGSTQLTTELQEVYDLVKSRYLQYTDQLPSFDVCLTMVNEGGGASFATINGVTLINEGYGFTMDDLSSESAYTFIARSVTPLMSISQFASATSSTQNMLKNNYT